MKVYRIVGLGLVLLSSLAAVPVLVSLLNAITAIGAIVK